MPLMPTQEQILVSDCRSALLGPACAHTRQDDWWPWYLRPRERERAGAQQRRAGARPKKCAKSLPFWSGGHPLLTSRQSRAHAWRPRTCSRGRLPWTLAQPDVSGRDVSSCAMDSASFSHRCRVTWSKVRANQRRGGRQHTGPAMTPPALSWWHEGG